MKIFILSLFTLLLASASPFSFPAQADVQSLMLPHSEVQIDQGSFMFRKWALNDPKDINLKTVTNYDSALLMTFSGADFSYLNTQSATSLKSVGPGVYEWLFSDANVDYKRTYEVQGDAVLVTVAIQFKQKAPEKAFLNLVSTGMKDDPETRDRELFYFTNSKIERNQVNKNIDPTDVATPIKWIGAGSRYFVFAVIPQGLQPEKLLVQSTAPHAAQSSLQFAVTNQQLFLKLKVALVPKKLDVLRSIDPALDTTVNLGFFTFIAYPILWCLKFIYKYVGNYGVAIIILTLLIKLLTFPLVMKSMKGARKMADFQPKMKALQEKHKDDKAALNVEMMAMMKASGYNPMAGCLPMVLQMPIFFALYSVLYAAEELYRAPFAFWLHDLSAKDPYFITPVLMCVVMFLQQKLTPPAPGMDPAQRKVMQFMPLMFGAFMITTPSGLCLYMLVNACASVAQQQYLNKKLGVSGNVSGMATSF
jgi:YidC/Oxa1 family membrane protein insertase